MALLIATANNAVRPMVSYRALALGATPADLGIVASSFAGVALFLAVPLGRVVDRFGERSVILAGSTVVALATAAVAATTDVLGLAVTQAALGAGQLSVVVAAHTLIANHGPDEGRANRFGIYTSMAALGHAIGPAVGGIILSTDPAGHLTNVAFHVASVAALVGFALGLVIPSTPRTAAHRGGTLGRGSVARALGSPGVRTAMLAGVAVIVAADLLSAYLPAYGEEHAYPPSVIGGALGVAALSQMVSRLGLGWLVTRFGHAAPLAACMLVAAVALPLLAVALPVAGLVAVMVVVGGALGLGQPLSLAWVAMATPPPIRGVAMGLRMGGNRLAQLVLPAAIGATAGQAAVAAVFVTLGGLLGLAGGYVAKTTRASTAGPAVAE
jgi:MFS family permease